MELVLIRRSLMLAAAGKEDQTNKGISRLEGYLFIDLVTEVEGPHSRTSMAAP